ncbi:MAG: hypothetical protein WCK98_01015 [bacterium]
MSKTLTFLINKLKELELCISLGPKLSLKQKQRIQADMVQIVNQIDTELTNPNNSSQISSNVKINLLKMI